MTVWQLEFRAQSPALIPDGPDSLQDQQTFAITQVNLSAAAGDQPAVSPGTGVCADGIRVAVAGPSPELLHDHDLLLGDVVS